ncbi:MAG: efflux RND transporter periplasmic adaptor subunit [Opitutae bacterium]|nr:efflux RND transporter periplasmic adaptor subunit [Opitutae bacterium]
MRKQSTLKTATVSFGILIAAGMFALPGCEKQEAKLKEEGPAMFPASTMVVKAEDRELREELPGRVDAIRNAEVRARATGIVKKIAFKEGDFVKANQVLFEIDPEELEALLASAEASLEAAKVQLESAEILYKRYSALVKTGGVSQQNYDDSRIAVDNAKANLLGCEAAVKTAKINLSYATVVSPIDGVIGEAIVTEGALVSASQATLLAVVQQMDPIYFDFSQSGRKLLEFRRAVKEGSIEQIDGTIPVKLLLEDGSEYSHVGTLKFSDVSVEQSTGMFKLRAEFPNPEHTLLPGMYARAIIVQGIDKKSILVPQVAVTRGTAGRASVFRLNENRIVETRSIKATEMDANGNWIVSAGLEPGDEIVIDSITQVSAMTTKGAVRIPTAEELKKMQAAMAGEKPAEAPAVPESAEAESAPAASEATVQEAS